MKEVLPLRPRWSLVDSTPEVGFILATVIAPKVGDVERFPRAENLGGGGGRSEGLAEEAA